MCESESESESVRVRVCVYMGLCVNAVTCFQSLGECPWFGALTQKKPSRVMTSSSLSAGLSGY